MGKPNRQRRQPVTVHNVPPSLQWQLIKFNNCFLEKQNGIKLSRERGNLTNRHGYKWNGLVHNKSIDIQPNATCKSGVTLKLRKRQRNKVSNQYIQINLCKNSRQTLKSVRRLISHGKYRQDLKSAALKRTSAILRSQNVGKRVK